MKEVLSMSDFLRCKELDRKVRDQIKIVLKYLVDIDNDAMYGCAHWDAHHLPKEADRRWPREMYILGDETYEMFVFANGQFGPVYVTFPIAYMFMDEDAIKKDIELTIKGKYAGKVRHMA